MLWLSELHGIYLAEGTLPLFFQGGVRWINHVHMLYLQWELLLTVVTFLELRVILVIIIARIWLVGIALAILHGILVDPAVLVCVGCGRVTVLLRTMDVAGSIQDLIQGRVAAIALLSLKPPLLATAGLTLVPAVAPKLPIPVLRIGRPGGFK